LKKPDAVEQALDRLAALKNEAGTPPKLTEVIFLKLDPLIITVSPDAAEAGRKEIN